MQKYFDALTSAYFKIAQDGRKLFCPWGIWGNCYILPSERDYERLRRQLRNFVIATLVLIIVVGGAFQSYVPVFIVAGLLAGFYLAWVRYLLRGLQPSTERLSLRESATSQAVTHSPAFLWLAEIVSIVFVVAGGLILVFDPANWHIGVISIGFFGLVVVFMTYMLVLRSRQVVR
jgi:hypothetical protein